MEGTSSNVLCREVPSERGTIFRLQEYERVGVLPVEVHNSVGKTVISVCKKI